MKITALAQAYAFRELAGSLPYPVALQLVTDEEVGGFNGTLHQLSRGVAADFVIIGEHSRLDIVADSKGIMRATLRAAGRAAHGAYPWLGESALWRLTETLHRIGARYPTPAEAAWRTTVNLARITTSNQAVNQIPADGEAWLDIRFPAEDTDLTGRTIEEVTEYLQTFCAPGVSVHVSSVDPPHHVDHDSDDIGRLRAAAEGQGYAGAFLYKHGAGDGRHYASHGIDSVVFGIGGDGQHGPDEYAEVATIAPYHAALCDFLRSVP
jgi:succinyl-diaminopimelate desuccinylase